MGLELIVNCQLMFSFRIVFIVSKKCIVVPIPHIDITRDLVPHLVFILTISCSFKNQIQFLQCRWFLPTNMGTHTMLVRIKNEVVLKMKPLCEAFWFSMNKLVHVKQEPKMKLEFPKQPYSSFLAKD